MVIGPHWPDPTKRIFQFPHGRGPTLPSAKPSVQLIARLLGAMLFVSGARILLNGEGYRATADEFLRGVGLIYMSGVMALLGGVAIVNLHNVWTRDWRLLVTLIG